MKPQGRSATLEACEAIAGWLRSVTVEGITIVKDDEWLHEDCYVIEAPGANRWPAQIGPAVARGELNIPANVAVMVWSGQHCHVWAEGGHTLPRPFEREMNEAWWEELGLPVREMHP